tara:strand:- start:471 stop:755 length:285 start_codon:yes stop_codon:yes gene_type:complete
MSSFRPNPEDIGPDGRLKDTPSAQQFKEKVQKFNKEMYDYPYPKVLKVNPHQDFGMIKKPDLMKKQRKAIGYAVIVGIVVFGLGYLTQTAKDWK